MKHLDQKTRRERIVKAAIALFSKKGFRGTKTKDIAKKAGISEALLFRHFPNKEELYKAILKFKMDEKFPILLADLPKEGPPEQIFLTVALRFVSVQEEDPSFLRLLQFSALEGHELSDLFFQTRDLPIRTYLNNYLEKEMEKGSLRRLDTDKTVAAFMSMISGYVMRRIIYRIPQIVEKPPEEFLCHYVKIFLDGITKR